MLEQHIEDLLDAIISFWKVNMYPPGFTPPKSSIDELRAEIGFYVAVFLKYTEENPAVKNPPYADLEGIITDLVDFYMEAYLVINSPVEEPLSEEEIVNIQEHFSLWIRSFLTYANTASEGIMWPPYIYSRPSPTNTINRLSEFINGLSSALTSALVTASFPPMFPASTQDISYVTAFHRAFVEPLLTYVHNNPSIAT